MKTKRRQARWNPYRKMMRMTCVVVASLLVAMFTIGCAGNETVTGTQFGSAHSDSGNITTTTKGTTTEERTYFVKPLADVHPSKQTVQTFGMEGSKLEETIQTHMGFSKAEPREDKLVFTVDLADKGFEAYEDALSGEVRPLEHFFFPFLNDNSAEALQFNDSISEKINQYAEALAFHKEQASGIRMGTTYKTYFYDGYLSIVMLDWMEDDGIGYVLPYTVVYDLARRKFLSKQEILKDLGLDLVTTTEQFDLWYAEGEMRVLDGYDYRRDIAKTLLEIWTEAYGLFDGTAWRSDYDRRHEFARTYHYDAGEPLESYAPYFIDDDGHFCMIKVTLSTNGANEDGLLPGSCYVPEYTSSFHQALRSDKHVHPMMGFEQLAKLTETEGQDIDAYLIYLGKNTDDGVAKTLEALNAEEGLSVPGMSLLSMWMEGGVLDLYVIVPKYDTTVVGAQRHANNDATEWQNYGHTIGYAMIVFDEGENEIHVVHRGRHGTLYCDGEKINVVKKGAQIFDATEWIVPKVEVSPEVNEIIEIFSPKG